MSTPKIGTLMWHIHHESSIEILTEPLQNRIDYIKVAKLASETETRLRWMTPVKRPGELPQRLLDVLGEWKEAYAKWKEAVSKYKLEIRALHAREHKGCPYSFEKGTLFP